MGKERNRERRCALCCDSGSTNSSLQWCDVKNNNKKIPGTTIIAFFSDPFLFLVGSVFQRSPMRSFFSCPGSNSANLPIDPLSSSAFHLLNWELAVQHLCLTHHLIFQLKMAAPAQLRWRHWVVVKEKISSTSGDCSGTYFDSISLSGLVYSCLPSWCEYSCIPYQFPSITYFFLLIFHHLYSSQTLLFNCSFWDLVVVHLLPC